MPYQSLGHRRHSTQFEGRWVSISLPPAALSERWLDAIPGGLAWAGLMMAFLGALYAPLTLVLVASLLGLYSAVRFAFAGVANLIGLHLVNQWEAKDWRAEYEHLAVADSLPLNDVHHVVLIPNYQEDIRVLRCTLDHLAAQPEARTSISIVLAMEVSEPGAREKGALLQTQYNTSFENFLVLTHPKGIAGEMQCKSANQAWAARWTKRIMVDEMGYNIDCLVVTTMDSDTLWHPHYFEALRVLFAVHPRRHATFWQAPIRYHGNVWNTNPLMRILHAYSSAWELAYLAAPWWQALPMSSYSLSMRLIDTVGYWDPDVIADEWHMFIKATFKHAGDIRLQAIFLPFRANATAGSAILTAIKERFLQTFRHAWGAKEIGYTIAQMNETRYTMSFWKGFSLLFRVAHDNILAGFGWIMITLGAQLPMLFHPTLVYNHVTTLPFILLQVSLAAITVLTIAFWSLDLCVRPPRPFPWSWRERLYELASLPLLAVMTFLCVALPVLCSQTRLMLGKPIQFRVAAKN